MKLHTSALVGDHLDAATALALGWTVEGSAAQYGYTRWRTPQNSVLCYPFQPSRDAGALVLELGIHLVLLRAARAAGEQDLWEAVLKKQDSPQGRPGSGLTQDVAAQGASPWEAACRCVVASRLGPVVTLPAQALPAPLEAEPEEAPGSARDVGPRP